MRTITCDCCGSTISDTDYVNFPSRIPFSCKKGMIGMKENPHMEFKFELTIERVTSCFCTTDIHICSACKLKALKEAVREL